MKSVWATESKLGVFIFGTDGVPRYVDSGEEFAAAVQAGPSIPADMSAIEALPDPVEAATKQPGLVVSRFQCRAALMQAGLLEAAEYVVSQADELTRMAWVDAIEFRRASPTIEALAAALGLDESGLDDLFAKAAQIEV